MNTIFKKGHIPWNKGLKGIHLSPKTEFKKGKEQSKKQLGENNSNWRGGKAIDINGYVRINTNKGRRLEHRVIMEKNLGRKLKRSEIIHHIDGDRQNNKLNNLMLFSSRSEHTKYHHENK